MTTTGGVTGGVTGGGTGSVASFDEEHFTCANMAIAKNNAFIVFLKFSFIFYGFLVNSDT
ncbi:hypothetical protein D3C85_962920 [compost metagenome]